MRVAARRAREVRLPLVAGMRLAQRLAVARLPAPIRSGGARLAGALRPRLAAGALSAPHGVRSLLFGDDRGFVRAAAGSAARLRLAGFTHLGGLGGMLGPLLRRSLVRLSGPRPLPALPAPPGPR
jgi:hypothetical protein